MEYFLFNDEEKAHNFFIKCLANGIYVRIAPKNNGYFAISVNVAKTLEAKNAKTKK